MLSVFNIYAITLNTMVVYLPVLPLKNELGEKTNVIFFLIFFINFFIIIQY